MHTEHSFKKSYFSHLNRCIHCNKISVLKLVYKCTGCSIISHQSCLEKNQYAINERHLRLEKCKVKDQITPVKINYNELGEILDPNYLYNMLIIEKRHPISLMSEQYLKARNAEHKPLYFAIKARFLEPYTNNIIAPTSRRLDQEPNTTITGSDQNAEAIEPFVSTSETNIEEQEQERRSGSPELGEQTPEPTSSTLPEPNAMTSKPSAAKRELSEPVSKLNEKSCNRG